MNWKICLDFLNLVLLLLCYYWKICIDDNEPWNGRKVYILNSSSIETSHILFQITDGINKDFWNKFSINQN